MNVIDVGGSVGLYASYWSKYCRNVYSFEPSSIVYKQLKKTSKKFKNIKCQKLAISNFKGKSFIYLDPKRLSENTIKPKNFWPKEKISLNTLDNLKIKNVCFIKIDTEGNEMNVLKGAIKMIKKYKPVVMCEIYYKNLNKDQMREIFNFFYDNNYNAFCKFYSQSKLFKIESIKKGIKIASDPKKLEEVDGDFLFVNNGSRVK